MEFDEHTLAQVAECLARLAAQLAEPIKTEELLQTVASKLRQDPANNQQSVKSADFSQYAIPGQMAKIPEFSVETFGTLVTAVSRMKPLTGNRFRFIKI